MSTIRRNSVIALAFAFLAICLAFVGIKARRHIRYLDAVTICSSNLRKIGQAAQQYEIAYHDWPLAHQDWDRRLIAAGLLKQRDTRCPVRQDKVFKYLVALPPTTQRWTGNEILLYENPEAHWGQSGCILYVDGHAVCVRSETYQTMLKRGGIEWSADR